MDEKLFTKDLRVALDGFPKVIDNSIDPNDFFAFLASCLPKILSDHKCNGFDFMNMNRLARENNAIVSGGSKMRLVDDMISAVVDSVID